jgi:hypothetical protein
VIKGYQNRIKEYQNMIKGYQIMINDHIAINKEIKELTPEK